VIRSHASMLGEPIRNRGEWFTPPEQVGVMRE